MGSYASESTDQLEWLSGSTTSVFPNQFKNPNIIRVIWYSAWMSQWNQMGCSELTPVRNDFYLIFKGTFISITSLNSDIAGEREKPKVKSEW